MNTFFTKGGLTKALAIVFWSSVTTVGGSQLQAADNPVPEKVAFDFIADGSRLELKDREFSIVPPRGWEVYTKHPNISLLLQAPAIASSKYQRTLQIAVFSGPRFIDEVTAKEYEDIIVRKFSEASVVVADYRMRNHMTIDMADKRPGLLFYSEFAIDSVDLMQAHILVSSKTRHYLLTFTDLATHFENEEASQFLTEAWEAMISVELAGPTPSRFEAVAAFGMIAAAAILLVLLLWGLRVWQAGRKYKTYIDDSSTVDVALNEPGSGSLQAISSMEVSESEVPSLVKKRQQKLNELANASASTRKRSFPAGKSEYNAGLGSEPLSQDAKSLDDDVDLAV